MYQYKGKFYKCTKTSDGRRMYYIKNDNNKFDRIKKSEIPKKIVAKVMCKPAASIRVKPASKKAGEPAFRGLPDKSGSPKRASKLTKITKSNYDSESCLPGKWSGYTVAQLKAFTKKLKIPSYGSKSQLCARIGKVLKKVESTESTKELKVDLVDSVKSLKKQAKQHLVKAIEILEDVKDSDSTLTASSNKAISSIKKKASWGEILDNIRRVYDNAFGRGFAADETLADEIESAKVNVESAQELATEVVAEQESIESLNELDDDEELSPKLRSDIIASKSRSSSIKSSQDRIRSSEIERQFWQRDSQLSSKQKTESGQSPDSAATRESSSRVGSDLIALGTEKSSVKVNSETKPVGIPTGPGVIQSVLTGAGDIVVAIGSMFRGVPVSEKSQLDRELRASASGPFFSEETFVKVASDLRSSGAIENDSSAVGRHSLVVSNKESSTKDISDSVKSLKAAISAGLIPAFNVTDLTALELINPKLSKDIVTQEAVLIAGAKKDPLGNGQLMLHLVRLGDQNVNALLSLYKNRQGNPLFKEAAKVIETVLLPANADRYYHYKYFVDFGVVFDSGDSTERYRGAKESYLQRLNRGYILKGDMTLFKEGDFVTFTDGTITIQQVRGHSAPSTKLYQEIVSKDSTGKLYTPTLRSSGLNIEDDGSFTYPSNIPIYFNGPNAPYNLWSSDDRELADRWSVSASFNAIAQRLIEKKLVEFVGEPGNFAKWYSSYMNKMAKYTNEGNISLDKFGLPQLLKGDFVYLNNVEILITDVSENELMFKTAGPMYVNGALIRDNTAYRTGIFMSELIDSNDYYSPVNFQMLSYSFSG